MKSKKTIYAFALTIGLITVGSALRVGFAKDDSYRQAVQRVENARSEIAQKTAMLNEAQSLEDDSESSSQAKDVPHSFARANMTLRAAAVSNGVKHSSLSVAGVSISQKSSVPLDKYYKPLTGSSGSVVAANIDVKGQYIDYKSFREYLNAISNIPASIRSIKISKNSFVMSVRIYASKAMD